MGRLGPDAAAVARSTAFFSVGFLLLRYSVVCTVVSLFLFYLLFIF